MRLDAAAGILEIGVGEVARAAYPDAGLPNRRLGLGAWLGQSLHLTYHERAPEEDRAFAAELPLGESCAHRELRMPLRGRPYGVRREADGWPVEELKSLGARREAWLPVWRLQAALYARMLERLRGEPVRAELVWIGDGVPVREPVALTTEAVERLLVRALDACLAELARKEQRRAAWRAAAECVRFPFPAPRPGQAEMLSSAAGALANGEQLLLEAATGSGKTAALLTPALRHALETGRPLYVLTASTLQQHLAIE